MAITGITPVLNVRDVPASLAWFESLGWERSFTWNDAGMIVAAADRNAQGPADFAGVCSGSAQVFLCQDGQGQHGTWMSWWLESPAEVDALHARAVELGHTVRMAPRNEPWGVRECQLEHPDGHVFRLSAGIGHSV